MTLAPSKEPALAQRCYHVAERYLAAQHEYKICSSFIPDPLQRFERIQELRTMHLKFARDRDPRLQEFAEKSFADESCRLIEILVGVGRKQEAEKVRTRALAVHDDPRIRDAAKVSQARRG